MPPLIVRDATSDDLPALDALKNAPSMHRDRLRDASQGLLRYLVPEREGEIVGFCQLVFERPAYWSDGADREHLPQVVDLQIAPAERSHGHGSLFLRHIAQMAGECGGSQLFAAVDPIENPRAHAFYRRLGFLNLADEPHRTHWHFTDSQGQRHEGAEWTLHLALPLAPAST